MAEHEPQRTIPDEELVRQVKAGDDRAMRLLFHRLLSPLYQFLRIRGASDAEAEDVAAETLETVFARIGDFRGEGRFFSWVCSIAWHSFLRRRSGARPEFVPLDECLEIPGQSALEPDELNRRREQVALCQALLDQLTTEQRQAVMLVELEGMSLKEAASVMDSTVMAVAKLLERAKRRMRTIGKGDASARQQTPPSKDEV